jgi:hypothetical protein
VQAAGQRGDELVAAVEAVHVVHALEPVDVDVADRVVLAGLHPVDDLAAHPGVAGQPGQRRDLTELLVAAQRRRDPGDQLGRVERLDQVVVDAGGQADDLVDGHALGGQHDHRKGRGERLGAQPAGQLDAVHPRHHPVDDGQVGAAALHHLEGLLAVPGLDHLVPVHPEVELDEARDVLVVVDHQDDVRAFLGLAGDVVGLAPDDAGAHRPTMARSARPRSLPIAAAGSSAP